MTTADAIDEFGTLAAYERRKLFLPWHVLRWHWTRELDEAEAEGQRIAEHVLSEMRRRHLFPVCRCADCRDAGFHGLRLPSFDGFARASDFWGDF